MYVFESKGIMRKNFPKKNGNRTLACTVLNQGSVLKERAQEPSSLTDKLLEGEISYKN